MSDTAGQPPEVPVPNQPEALEPQSGTTSEERTVGSGDGASSTTPVEPQKRKRKRLQIVAAVGSVATIIIAVTGIYFGLKQIEESDHLQKESNRLRRAQLDSHLEEVMMGIDRYFASHPRLRPFFFAIGHPERFPSKGPLRGPAMGTAEMVIDFADDVGAYAQMRRMAPADSAQWRRIVGGYFSESPVMRYMWKRFHHAYNASTACILQAPIKPAKLRRWHWLTNTPREVAHQCS